MQVGLLALPIYIFSPALVPADALPARENATNVCEREILRASSENGVPAGVLFAVALTETGQRGALHEFAMNVGGRSVFNGSLIEALDTYAAARRSGVALIDVGCMQINVHYHGEHFGSVREMFDPAQNVQYAAKFLRRLRASEGSWTAAVARYHAGPSNYPAQKSYICAVIDHMVASGFGGRTPQSQNLCGR